jgi:hypothetical protein
MDAFDVQVYRADTKTLLHVFSPSQSLFAAYHRGDYLDLRPQGKGTWEIATISVAVIEKGTDRLHRTSLFVTALNHPFSLTEDGDQIPWA